MKTEEDSSGDNNKKGVGGRRKRSSSLEGFDDDSPTTSSSDGFRSSAQKRGRKKKPPSVQSVEELIFDARNRARIRRQKKKEYIDGMQRDVLSLSHKNAFLRQKNDVLETLLEEAKKIVVKKELREAQETLRNYQAMSAIRLSSFDRQTYATSHVPWPMAKQYCCTMQGILKQHCNENAFLRQTLVQDILRSPWASHVGRSQFCGLGMNAAYSTNNGMNTLNYERNNIGNNGVGLALNHNATSNSYPKTPLHIRNEHSNRFHNEAISQREIGTMNPIPTTNHERASALLGQIIKNEANKLIQSFAGSLPNGNIDSRCTSAVVPINPIQQISRDGSYMRWPSNPGNNFHDRDIIKHEATLNLLGQDRKPSATQHGMVTTYTRNALDRSIRANTSARVFSNESARNNT